MSDIDALQQEARNRQVAMYAAWERLDLAAADADPPNPDPAEPESRRERNLRLSAAAYADQAALYRAAQTAVRNAIARRASRRDLIQSHARKATG